MSITAAAVLAIMTKIPAECSFYRGFEACPKNTPGHYERGAGAKDIATAIAARLQDPWDALEAAIYASYESSATKQARGDCHGERTGDKTDRKCRSFGPWQTGIERATTAEYLEDWIALRDDSREACASLPPEFHNAKLASGSCGRGHFKVAIRDAVARRFLPEFMKLCN